MFLSNLFHFIYNTIKLITYKFVSIHDVYIYFISFIFGRGLLFLSPLILANFLSNKYYAYFEISFASATIISNFFGLGTASALPIILLKMHDKLKLTSIIAYNFFIALILFFAAIFFRIHEISLEYCLVLVMSADLILQSLASSHLRALGYAKESLFVETSLIAFLALVVFGAYILKANFSEELLIQASSSYFIFLLLIYLRQYLLNTDFGNLYDLKASLKLSFPLMLGSIISVLVVTSGRFGIGVFGDVISIADYGVLSRVATVPILAHQLIMISMFRNLYLLDGQDLEIKMIKIILFVALTAIMLYIWEPTFSPLLGERIYLIINNNKVVAKILVAQSVLWSAIALNELVITRQNITSIILPSLFAIVLAELIFCFCLFTLTNFNLNYYVYIHSFMICLFYVLQSTIVFRAGFHQPKVWTASILTFIGLVIAAFIT